MKLPYSPYVGPIPYTEIDAPFFFGRNLEKQTIGFNLRGSRLTIFYGPSGVGKSSVLHAGVAHDLHLLATENFERTGQAELIAAVFSSWQDDPVKGLVKCVGEAIKQIVTDFDLSRMPAEPGLVLAIESWTAQLNIDLLIILDQFEDYFFYHRNENGVGSFADEFARAVNRKDLRVHFLISIREDAVAKLDAFKPRIPALFGNYLRIERLKIKDARAAILEPIGEYNKRLAKEQERYTVEVSLVEEVCKQVATPATLELMAPGGNGRADVPIDDDTNIEAPLLQAVMMSVWEEEIRQQSHTLRLITLEMLGEAKTIVRGQLDRELGHLVEKEQARAANMFHYLVTPSGLKIALTLKDLAGYTQQKEDDLRPVLGWLSGNVRILRAVPSSNQVLRYEIFHDVLAQAVLDWVTSYKQEQERKKDRDKFERRQAASRERANADLETARNRVKRRSILLSIMLAGLVLLTAMYVYAIKQRTEALKAQAQSQEERNRFEYEVNYRNQVEREIPYYRAVLRGHTSVVSKAVFSPDGVLLATASDDRTAHLWNINGHDLRKLQHDSPVVDLVFSKSGRILATVASRSVYLWQVHAPSDPTELTVPVGTIKRVAFSPDEQSIATVGDDPIVRIWDIASKQIKYELKGHTGLVNDVAFSSTGELLVTASVDYTARVWKIGATEPPMILGGHVNAVNTAAFSRDDRYVVTASDDWNGRVWDLKTGRAKILAGHKGVVHSAEFSPDGRFITTGSADQTGRVWDLVLGQSIQLRGHTDDVVSAHFDRDGLRIITASGDHTARIWDRSTGTLLYDLKAHFRALKSAYIQSEGKLAITASADTTARIWAVGDAGVLTVSEPKVSADPSEYSGPCPAYVRVFGRISVAGLSGEVRYRFVKTIGGQKTQEGKEKTLSFDGPGTKEIGTVYAFYASTNGSFHLDVLFPAKQKSQEVSFQIRCESPPKEPKKDGP